MVESERLQNLGECKEKTHHKNIVDFLIEFQSLTAKNLLEKS